MFAVWKFDYPLVLVVLQLMLSTLVMYLVAKPKLELRIAKSVLPLSIVNLFSISAGFMGTQGLNIPMFVALRRFTILFTVIVEYLMFRKRQSVPTLSAVAIMISGALIASVTDLTFSAPGYAAVFINDLLQAAYLVIVKYVKDVDHLGTNGLLFYNSGISVLPLVLFCWVRGDFHEAMAYPYWGSLAFLTSLFSSTCLGLAVGHAMFLCTRVNEPLTTTVTGSIKNLLATVLGAVAFGDYIFNTANAAGLAVSAVGSLWYVVCKTQEASPRQEGKEKRQGESKV
mmetsp:Transcript_9728/g.59069  ORF Transcript_9728/g.59069 Transcript_9728/m.59069 type:complete len:284 (+) Transcript_9728:196-1047(+)